MKKALTIFLLSLSVFTLSATDYYLGAEGGIAFNTVVAGKGYRNYKYSVSSGYKVSVPFTIMFTKNYGLDTGLSLYGKNYKYSQRVAVSSTSNQTNFNLKIENIFLELPVSFRLNFPLKSFDLYCSLGGYVGWWLYGDRSGTTINGNGNGEAVDEITDLSLYNRIDAGVSVEFGADINFYERFRSYIEAEIAFSATSMNKKQKFGAYLTHNATLSITLGMNARFN